MDFDQEKTQAPPDVDYRLHEEMRAKMTFRRKAVIRILLLVARMVDDGRWAKEIEHICNHILAGPTEELELLKA